MRFFKLWFVLFCIAAQAQQGGMWIPSLLTSKNESEMRGLGCKISLKDIYDANGFSLKDAVPQFNGGCTSEVISPKGLILTNHHCGFDAIQNHSTLEHDYLKDGFWAYKMEDEIPNADLEVTFIVKIEDVTQQIFEGTSTLQTEAEKQKKIQQNISDLNKSYPKEVGQENRIRSFYDGNQYLLFVVESFKDIRFVGAPPSSIGKFGSDTDNWVWPRHTGDFSLFRIYADKNNRPAAYSKDNVPYKPKKFLPISISGVEENDFTMILGFPGRTQEYLPAVAVNQIMNDLNPAKIEIREAALKIQDGFMRNNPEIKIQYASKYASIANYWKKWIGETKGLKKSNAVALKQKFETDFLQKVAAAGKQNDYGNLLLDFETNYAQLKNLALARDYFSEVVQRNCELLSFAYRLFQLEQVFNLKGEQAFTDRKKKLLTAMAEVYKEYDKTVDKAVFEKLIEIYSKKAPKQFLPQNLIDVNSAASATAIYSKSKLTTYEGFKTLLEGDSKTVLENINTDEGYAFLKSMAEFYQKNVVPTLDDLTLKNVALQRTYMKAILELMPNARIFPDANSTLRITYGKVKGYQPADGVVYESITYLDGVLEKYVPNDYEFDVPQKLIDLYRAKEYGIYGKNGKMPVCFIGTNHTTGGNSGSPAVDAYGNLIGLNFDRVWEGTMSDLNYSPEICRNIMVDARYILFIIDKFANAKNLISELSLVTPKKITRKN